MGKEPETATWIFNNIPPGYYDIVLYLDPFDELRGDVEYKVNDQLVHMRSDFYYQDPDDESAVNGLKPILPADYGGTTGYALDGYSYYTAKLPPSYIDYLNNNIVGYFADIQTNWATYLTQTPSLMLAQAYNNQFLTSVLAGGFVPSSDVAGAPGYQALSMLRLPYRLYPRDTAYRAEVGSDGQLSVTIVANPPESNYYVTTFDRIELINLDAQYLELVNLTPDDIDLTGWTVNTPYGKYVLGETGWN